MTTSRLIGFAMTLLPTLAPALARERCVVTRLNPQAVELQCEPAVTADVWRSGDTVLDRRDVRVRKRFAGETLRVDLPAATRQYLILVQGPGRRVVVAERLLPLEQGSNFRDLGGYPTRDGHTVRWGKVFRSAGMPMLTDRDYQLLAGLDLDSVVDLRALQERELMPDQLDDRTGALFLSNDYPLRDLISHMGADGTEDIYRGLEKLLVPQFRMALSRMLADHGAVVFHDVWGQDRAGVFAALLYDVLGVDRATIREDFHLSQRMRRPQFEIPDLDPAAYPGNPIVKYYASKKMNGVHKAESLYTPAGASHIDRFMTYIDAEYGGSAPYFTSRLGQSAADIARLKTLLLE